MVKIACSHGGNNFWIYKDNWSMQEEVEFIVQIIQDWQISKWHFKGEKIWMQLYESIGQWWHQIGIVMKHVTTSANDTYWSQFENNIELLEKQLISKQHHNLKLKEIRKKFMNKHLACSPTWWKTIMVKNFENTNVLLERVDHQMDWIINKL